MSSPRLLLLAPLPAIALGASVAASAGVPPVAFLPNLAAAALGALGCVLLARRPLLRGPAWIPAAAVWLLALTLLAPGLDGVHRWLPLGPVPLHASSVAAPFLLAAQLSRHWLARLVPVAALLVLLAQPDAGQATALALGSVAVSVRGEGRRLARAGLCVLILGLAAATWLRADPLQAIAHVERIVELVVAAGPGWTAAAMGAAALIFAPLLRGIASPSPPAVTRALAFTLYLAAAVAVTFAGNFPVPILGAGAAPVLGWYAMVGLLGASGSASRA